MQLEEFLVRVKHGGKVSFLDSMAIISANYDYTPTRFINGDVVNEAGTNEGSCKLFYLARLSGLTPEQTLGLFGDYYWKDVMEHPDASNHANIRSFMKHGWAGIAYDQEALCEKSKSG
jgi:hypothetical protein